MEEYSIHCYYIGCLLSQLWQPDPLVVEVPGNGESVPGPLHREHLTGPAEGPTKLREELFPLK